MGYKKDLTGQKFNRLTAIQETGERIRGSVVGLCRCDCGNLTKITSTDLVKGFRKSCGCLKKESDRKPKGNVKDLTGKKFGALTVIARAGSNKVGLALGECVCDCGNPQHLIKSGYQLRTNHARSCGCLTMSRGESKIAELLHANGIPFEFNKPLFKFQGSNHGARFDFYIDNKYIIEYDGQCHFSDQASRKGGNTEDAISATQERDDIKTSGCIQNKIPLIRIPYQGYENLCINDLLLQPTNRYVIKETNPNDIDYPLEILQKEMKNAEGSPINLENILIDVYSLKGDYLQTCNGYTEAMLNFGVKKELLQNALSGKLNHTKNGQFRLHGDPRPVLDVRKSTQRKISQKNLDDSLVKVYENLNEAKEELNQQENNGFSNGVLLVCQGKFSTYLGYKGSFAD